MRRLVVEKEVVLDNHLSATPSNHFNGVGKADRFFYVLSGYFVSSWVRDSFASRAIPHFFAIARAKK